MRSEILAAFPDDVGRYIEVFGGAGWVLFGKDPTRQMEVFNDADGSLINIYRCIKYHPEAVAAELALLPDSREVFFDSAAQTDCRGLTDIQRAARSLYLIKMSFGCDRRTFATAPKIAGNISASFAPVQERLRKVIIEHLDFEQLIRTYDRPNALFYCDPPYMGTEKYYQAAFSTLTMSVWHEFYIIFAGAFCFHIMIAKLSVSYTKTAKSRRWCGGTICPVFPQANSMRCLSAIIQNRREMPNENR